MRRPRKAQPTRNEYSPELRALPAETRERLRRLVLTTAGDDEVARQAGVTAALARAMRRRLTKLGVLEPGPVVRQPAARPSSRDPRQIEIELF
jgi:hypothetical protein